MEVLLRATDLRKSYGSGKLETVAVRDVSLEMQAGEMTVLMGPSGSGKSTLLALLAGLLRPDRGIVETMGVDLWKVSESKREAFRRRHCGFIFQGYNLFPALTARQQLEIVLQWGSGIWGVKAKRMALDALEPLGMRDKARLRPAQLSGGEKQRVAVARALVKKPELIFADEPTAALDWEHGQQVVRMLRAAIHEMGTTVLLVSHDPRLIPLADRVLHLEDGQILEQHVNSVGAQD